MSRELVEAVRAAIKGFDRAAAALDALTAADAAVHRDTKTFVTWCRHFITGTLKWSLESERYGMQQCMNENGSLDIKFL